MPATTSRSTIFRMTAEQKVQLAKDAEAAGLTQQAYMEKVLFGYVHKRSRPGPAKRAAQNEELPMTG